MYQLIKIICIKNAKVNANFREYNLYFLPYRSLFMKLSFDNRQFLNFTIIE